MEYAIAVAYVCGVPALKTWELEYAGGESQFIDWIQLMEYRFRPR